MACQTKHNWVHVYSEADSDYDPSTSIWWCSECGRIIKRSEFDGRIVREWTQTPTQATPSAPQ